MCLLLALAGNQKEKQKNPGDDWLRLCAVVNSGMHLKDLFNDAMFPNDWRPFPGNIEICAFIVCTINPLHQI